MACNAYMLSKCKWFLFGTLIVHGLQMTTKVLDCRDDQMILVKGQGENNVILRGI